MKIESTDQDIRTLLSSGYFRIPRFQRPYSWDRENIEDFWEDIVKERPVDYFIGSMVVYKAGSQSYGVVDGQQRLTTITILLCVLRDRLDKLELVDLASGIQNLVERRNIDNKEQFILSTESSFPFFQDYIQKRGKPEIPVTPHKEEDNLQNAYDQLKQLVDSVVASVFADSSLSETEKTTEIEMKLVKIRDALLDLKLIFVKLEDENDAYVIFETLNTRGKDLALADLVKNHVTKHLKSRSASVDQAKLKWERILETIQGSSVGLDPDTFIHHFWLSRYDYLPAKKLFKVIRKRITRPKAKTFLDALVADSAYYRSIHETAYGKWSKQESRIQESLDALQLFRVQQQTPCVLSLVREYRHGKIRKKHLESGLVVIEKFHFLFTAVTSQRSSGGISAMYAALGRRLFEARDTQEAVDVIRDLEEKLRDRIPSKDEVVALFPYMVYTDNITKQRKLVRYVLTTLWKAAYPQDSLDCEAATIEHFLPQSEIGQENLDGSTVGQLGNLLLVPQALNAKLQNKSPIEKRTILESANYRIPTEIETAKKWADEEIKQRTRNLAELAYERVWRI